MTIATSTELQNNFGKYLQMVIDDEEVIIIKNGKEAARLISYYKSLSLLTDSITGVLKNEYDEQLEKEERLKKYENND